MNKKTFILFICVVSFGIFLRAFYLGNQSVWIDEYITAYFANENNFIKVFLSSYINDPHPPLYYILVHFIVKIFGNSEISLRFISFLFGVINIFISYKIVRSFFSEEIALTNLILFSFSSYQIYYSQEARMYTIFLTFALLIIYYFLISIKYNSFTELPFIIFSVLGLYIHIYILFLLIILNLIYYLKFKEDIRQELWLKANLIILVFYIPMLPFLIRTIVTGDVANKINLFFAPFYTFKSFLFGLTIKMNLFLIILFFYFAFLILLSVISKRRYKEKKIIDILFAVALIFILIPWIESIIGKPVYSNRTLIPVAFILLLLSSIGISYLFKTMKIITIAIYVIINFYSLYNYYFVDKYQKINYQNLYLKVLNMNSINNKEIIIHTNIPSYASFEFYKKFKYMNNIENKYISEIPEYTGSKLKILIRDMWRFFKNRLKIDVYAGYDKNIITPNELIATISNYSKIYLVIDNEEGLNQINLPHSQVWERKFLPYKLYNINELEWVKNFIIKQKIEIYGCKMYVLEKL
jgi:uncharacterized membrane protein